MKALLGFFLSFILLAPAAQARDSKHMLPIQQAMASAEFKNKLDPEIKFYFGNQKHPRAIKTIGNFATNKKTNAFAKSDEEACRWVFLSALLTLQERARSEGGNAVINVASNYKQNTFSSNSQYECHAGAIMAGVALTGDIVRVK